MKNIEKYIDHTILKPEATSEDVKRICEEARKYKFASVCINPKYVKMAVDLLKDSEVNVCTVIGFPLGANTSEVKAFEAEIAICEGAKEVDMVIDIGAAKEHDFGRVKEDICKVKEKVNHEHVLKVIIETCLLTEQEKKEVCKICAESGVDFVKTSTGFSTGGAEVEDVRLMRASIAPDMKVKASGGIRNRRDAEAMIEAGAERLGTSAGVAIIKGE